MLDSILFYFHFKHLIRAMYIIFLFIKSFAQFLCFTYYGMEKVPFFHFFPIILH